MKIPEIDPELHGLLDEVVTDPRSALRRTPRRALLEWFGNPDSAHVRPVDATTAERHLVAVYRESLAEIFRESALVAYYQAPFLCNARRDFHGERVDQAERVEVLRRKARKAVDFGQLVGLGAAEAKFLELCWKDLPGGPACEWSRLSFALFPNEFGHFVHALTLPRSAHHEAIGILQTLSIQARERHRRKDSYNQMAVRMVDLGWLALAREQHVAAAGVVSESPEAALCAFNLSCFLGDPAGALHYSRLLEDSFSLEDERLQETTTRLARWSMEQPRERLRQAKRTMIPITRRLGPQALRLIGEWR